MNRTLAKAAKRSAPKSTTKKIAKHTVAKKTQKKKTVKVQQQRAFSTETASLGKSGVKKFGVIGAGQMGNGIAIVAANVSKLPVTVVDTNQKSLDNAQKFLAKLMDKDVTKGKLTRELADEALGRINYSTDMGALGETDFVVEAATEDLALKLKIFAALDQIAPKGAILGTNTSSISITKIAAATGRPEDVIGMHFMNPVPVMKLVEIIPGLRTSIPTLTTTLALAAEMGKTTTQSRDFPGFIANRILMPYINEAVFVLQEGIASPQDIDTTMKLGTNVPMGPLTLADFIGLDTCLSIMKVLHAGAGGDSKYRPAPLLQQYVDAGYLGKKSGRGFFDYTPKL
jgi:3-hydroxybutyryl-CoA dehydrogenase